MKKHLNLEFNGKYSINAAGKHVRDGLSTAIILEDSLWIACDERSSLERLTKTDKQTFGKHQSFDLKKYLELPGGADCEIDVEGLGFDDHYLWLVGSHSLARKKPKKSDPPEKQIKRLAKVKDDPSRYLLARIPMIRNRETGEFELHKSCAHPDIPNVKLHASQLVSSGEKNKLMQVLASDIHLKPFMQIPGKDNGFDIEGLALSKEKIYIGLRGPVLRGWAMILEVEIEESKSEQFKLKPIGEDGKFYKKHFLHLEGMGIRELRVVKNDLLILAGPTMDLDGTISVYRWKDAMKQQEAAIVHRKELERLFDVPHGSGETSGQDKAEGMALYDDNHVLIVFDSPTDKRKLSDNGVQADVYKI
ncbi:DUF3616 domain-containing protein [Adhaeribacter sp. BT258]|uniref:DUF3616 domain-containing protein n=1 Tax=Adhaeribacter terrigena TaxID=2793070 RepID=A0ABS1C4M7_9BACT|nr:DUF3616 domain-containing protein [Adhaeribacter terrigena]MBK0404341.1 DUF3616 domain-containing protein [Adhaeribacter terrigena]